ncbi:MAG: hypothetical protein AAFZ17_18885 [Cyanobacteria bacterium J06650_10]
MKDNGDYFKGKSIRLYPEENAIGFVFENRAWARRFYLETLVRGQEGFKLVNDEVILQINRAKETE